MSRKGDCWDKRGRRKLLQILEARAWLRRVQNARRGKTSRIRVGRGPLQPSAIALRRLGYLAPLVYEKLAS